MRKIFALFVAMLMLAVACEPDVPTPDEPTPDDPIDNPTPDPDPDVEAVVLPYLSGLYFGNQYGASPRDYNYSVVLATQADCYDIISGDILILECSQYLFLDIYASEPAEEYNVRFSIPVGEYRIDTTNSAMSGTISSEYSSLYTTNETTGDEVFFAEGTVTVSEEGIVAHLVSKTGEECHFSCPTRTVDNSQNFHPSYTPPEQSTLEGDLHISFDDAVIVTENYGDYYVIGKSNWSLILQDKTTGDSLYLELLAPMGDAVPTGIFPVTNDLNEQQMVLPGYVDVHETMWSWYMLYADYTTVTSSAPIADGKIEIAENDDGTLTVDVDLVDDMGNRIWGTCHGGNTSFNPDPDPDAPVSTLKGDIVIDFDPECSMCYADCFGDYYKTGMYMWGFYIQNYTSKEQLYIEVMHPDHLYEVPVGTFTANDNIYAENALLKGTFDFEGYEIYSWYQSLATDSHDAAKAPIVEGTMKIAHDEETGNYRIKLDLKDDAGNTIRANYFHRVVLEDFRI